MQKLFLVVASLFVLSPAMAQIVYDVTAATDAISGGTAPILTIGVAGLILAVVVKVVKKLRGAA